MIFWIFFSYFVSHSWGIPMMKITGLSHLFKWENLHNWWLTKYFFAPLYICEFEAGTIFLNPRTESYSWFNSVNTYVLVSVGAEAPDSGGGWWLSVRRVVWNRPCGLCVGLCHTGSEPGSVGLARIITVRPAPSRRHRETQRAALHQREQQRRWESTLICWQSFSA